MPKHYRVLETIQYDEYGYSLKKTYFVQRRFWEFWFFVTNKSWLSLRFDSNLEARTFIYTVLLKDKPRETIVSKPYPEIAEK